MCGIYRGGDTYENTRMKPNVLMKNIGRLTGSLDCHQRE